MGVLLCIIREKVVSLQKISRMTMKSKLLIWTIGAMALCLMSACANGDVQRVQKAEELLTVNRDSAMTILREVVRPDQLPEESPVLVLRGRHTRQHHAIAIRRLHDLLGGAVFPRQVAARRSVRRLYDESRHGGGFLLVVE